MALKSREGKNWSYRLVDPLVMARHLWPEATDEMFAHITYDPNLRRGRYSINRGQAHDGTLAFTYDLFASVLVSLVNKTSYYRGMIPDLSKVVYDDVRYTVGPISVATVIGSVALPASTTRKFHGQRERMRMPVIFEPIGLRSAEAAAA